MRKEGEPFVRYEVVYVEALGKFNVIQTMFRADGKIQYSDILHSGSYQEGENYLKTSAQMLNVPGIDVEWTLEGDHLWFDMTMDAKTFFGINNCATCVYNHNEPHEEPCDQCKVIRPSGVVSHWKPKEQK